jgi:hypothetical protein
MMAELVARGVMKDRLLGLSLPVTRCQDAPDDGNPDPDSQRDSFPYKSVDPRTSAEYDDDGTTITADDNTVSLATGHRISDPIEGLFKLDATACSCRGSTQAGFGVWTIIIAYNGPAELHVSARPSRIKGRNRY